MKRILTALGGLGLAISATASAQSNDDTSTPLGSRIQRDRQIQQNLLEFTPRRMDAVNRKRREAQLTHFARCIYDRSNENAMSLISLTDYGFSNPAQIGKSFQQLAQDHGFNDCLTRVATTTQRSTRLALTTANLRAMLLEQAYFDRFPDQPTWWRAGYEAAPRSYPLSAENTGVLVAMDFADCIVAANPGAADFFYRAPEGSDEEKQAIRALQPLLGPCLAEGRSLELKPFSLRVMLGEALWHAATTSRPAPADPPEEAG